MLIYIGAFALSTGLFALFDKKENIIKYSMITLALIIPCLIAGIRGTQVGTDVQVYLLPMFEAALDASDFSSYQSSSWYHIWQDLYVRNYEVGFTALVYFVGRLTRSLVPVQFMIQALTIVPFYLAARRDRECPVWLSMLVYYLMFYNSSLNLMRQFIAMAFVLLAIRYLAQERYIRFLACILIGYLFHESALIGLGIGIIFLLVTRQTQITKWKLDSGNLAMILILSIALLLLIKTDIFVQFLQMAGLGKYQLYIAGATEIMPRQLLIRLPIFCLFLLHWKSGVEADKTYRFYFVMICMDMIFSQFTSVNVYGGRISLFFSMFYILSFAMFAKQQEHQKATRAALGLYLACYWLFFFVIRAQDSTVPYLFFWN